MVILSFKSLMKLHNPYHDELGRFTTKDRAVTGDVFGEQWDVERRNTIVVARMSNEYLRRLLSSGDLNRTPFSNVAIEIYSKSSSDNEHNEILEAVANVVPVAAHYLMSVSESARNLKLDVVRVFGDMYSFRESGLYNMQIGGALGFYRVNAMVPGGSLPERSVVINVHKFPLFKGTATVADAVKIAAGVVIHELLHARPNPSSAITGPNQYRPLFNAAANELLEGATRLMEIVISRSMIKTVFGKEPPKVSPKYEAKPYWEWAGNFAVLSYFLARSIASLSRKYYNNQRVYDLGVILANNIGRWVQVGGIPTITEWLKNPNLTQESMYKSVQRARFDVGLSALKTHFSGLGNVLGFDLDSREMFTKAIDWLGGPPGIMDDRRIRAEIVEGYTKSIERGVVVS